MPSNNPNLLLNNSLPRIYAAGGVNEPIKAEKNRREFSPGKIIDHNFINHGKRGGKLSNLQ